MTEPVELVFFEGCPHVAQARRELARALCECGLPPTWREWDTTRPETPASRKGYPSPTVLVEGKDVTGGELPGPGTGCVVAGAPQAELIVAALKRQGS